MALPDSFDHEKENTHSKLSCIDLISEIGQCDMTSVKTVVSLLCSNELQHYVHIFISILTPNKY